MRILLVVHQFLPDFSAGTEILTLHVARELRARGHEVRVFSGNPSRDDLPEQQRCNRYHYNDFEVYRFEHAYVAMGGQSSMIEVGSDNAIAAQYFARVLAEFRPHRVHYFHLNRLGTGLIAATEAAGIKQSMTPTDFWTICPTAQLRYPDGGLCGGPSQNAGNCVKHFAQNASRGLVMRTLARALPTPAADALVRVVSDLSVGQSSAFIGEMQALGRRLPKTIARLNGLDAIFAPTDFMRSKLVEYGVEPDRVIETPFGVMLPTRVQVGQQDSASRAGEPLRVGFIGTLAPHKGPLVLLQAARLCAQGAVQLRLYGNLSEFPEYAEQLQAAAAGMGDEVFAGVFPNEAIFEVLDGIDVLVVPSLWYENTPLVIHSAHAAGKIVIASDLPGMSGIVQHEIDGLLFAPGDARALAVQLERLGASPSLRISLQAAIRPPKSSAHYTEELLERWEMP